MDIDKTKVVAGQHPVNRSYALIYSYGNYLMVRRSTENEQVILRSEEAMRNNGIKKRLDRNPASCKIQYPMKNRVKDAGVFLNFKTYFQNKFFVLIEVNIHGLLNLDHLVQILNVIGIYGEMVNLEVIDQIIGKVYLMVQHGNMIKKLINIIYIYFLVKCLMLIGNVLNYVKNCIV